VGNPPFLGDKKMIGVLGEEYVGRLRSLYEGRVPGGADLVTYWFEKARTLVEQGKVQRAGLVATNSIRGGQNRKVLERIRGTGVISSTPGTTNGGSSKAPRYGCRSCPSPARGVCCRSGWMGRLWRRFSRI
jgi:type II restriction/modification system DNA methylase subunit YeeA